MKHRALTILAGVAAVAALAAGPATAANAATATTAAARPELHYAIFGHINGMGGVGLQFEGFSDDKLADYIEQPTSIPNGGAAGYVLGMTSTGNSGAYGTQVARVMYQGKTMPYWVAMYSSVYWHGLDKGACTFYTSDPSVDPDAKATELAPFGCDVSSVDHSDPWQITFDLSPKPAKVVTDRATQQFLVQSCPAATENGVNGLSCTFVPTSKTVVSGPERGIGPMVNNPTDETVTHRIAETTTEGATDSLGVTIGAKVEAFDIWELSIESNYEHTWEWSRDFTFKEDLEVPAHKRAWFTISPRLNEITGDYLISYGGKLFEIKGFTVDLPMTDQPGDLLTAHLADALPGTGAATGAQTVANPAS